MANKINLASGQDIVPDLPSGEIWTYCRYSDADKQDGRSIEQQVLANREAAATLDLSIQDDCIFADAGIQGWKDDRPALNHMMNLIRTGKVKCTRLFIFDVTRSSRILEHSRKFQNFFDFHGVIVHYVADGLVSGTKGFKLIHSVKSVIAETFLDGLSENVKRGHANQFDKRYFAHAKTYGYDHVADLNPAFAELFDNKKNRFGVRPVINPAQASVISEMVQMYKLGKGYNGIARVLNERGIKSPRRPTKHRQRLWGTSSVRSILENPRYTGLVTFGVMMRVKDPETGKFRNVKRPESEWRTAQDESLRIISDEDFEEVKRIRSSRDVKGRTSGGFTAESRKDAGYNKAGNIYPWSRFLFCKDCEGPMNILQGGTYMCQTAFRGGDCNNHTKLKRNDFQVQMLEKMSSILMHARGFDGLLDSLMDEIELQSKVAKSAAVTSAARRGSVQSKLANVSNQIDNLAVAMARNPNSEALDSVLRNLEAEKKILVGELAKPLTVEVKPISREEVAEFLSEKLQDLYNVLRGDLNGYREVVRKYVGKLFLKPVVFENAPAFEIHGDLRLFADKDEKCSAEKYQLQQSILRCKLNLSGLLVKVDGPGNVLKIAEQPIEAAASGELMRAA